jgi:hypothetical protein
MLMWLCAKRLNCTASSLPKKSRPLFKRRQTRQRGGFACRSGWVSGGWLPKRGFFTHLSYILGEPDVSFILLAHGLVAYEAVSMGDIAVLVVFLLVRDS